MPLDPTAKFFLDDLAKRNPPTWPEIPVEKGREIFESWKDLFGEGPQMAKVEDRQTDDGVAVRVFVPESPQPLGTLVYFHGGGWVLGDVRTHDTLCRQFAAESNCNVVAVDYRRAPEHQFPVALDDSYSATRYAAACAKEFNVSEGNLIVAGDSAGGNLAASVCLKARDEKGPQIKLQLLIYPVIDSRINSKSYTNYETGYGLTKDTMAWFWKQYAPTTDQQAHPYASPCLADDHANLPAAHVALAEYDVLHSEGELYAETLRAAGVETTVTTYDGQIHGFVHTNALFTWGKKAISDMAQIIQQRLGSGS